MIEKIKSKLSALIKSRQLRLGFASLLTAAAIACATLLTCSIHTIKIFDGSKTYTVRSFDKNIAMAIETVDLESEHYEVSETVSSDSMTSVKITYGFPVYITQGNKTIETVFYGGTVRDALMNAGFTPDKHDFAEPSFDTVINDSCYIDYTDINYIKTTKKQSIPFKTATVYTDNLNDGEKKVARQGKNGIKEVTVTEKLVNGVSVSSDKKVKVISKSVNKKVLVGTTNKKKITDLNCVSTLSPKTEIELDKNGVPVNYKSKMTVRATAYTHTGNPCSTGVMPKPGYIAVNPKVIPYGTKMFIKTTDGNYIYGYAVAADTGGFIKRHPTGIDLFFDTESECRQFGVRTAEIYILE